MRRKSTTRLAAAAVPSQAATGPYLVKDIVQGGSSWPHELTDLNGTLIFASNGDGKGRELWRTGTFRYANAYPAAIALAASGRVEVDDLVTARYALDETESALRSTRSEPGVLKAVVQPGSPPPP